MRKLMLGFVALLLLCGLALPAQAHFGMVIPQTNQVERPTQVQVEFRFWHPMENHGMDLVKPAQAGVFLKGRKESLLDKLKPIKIEGRSAWRATYRIKRPGDYYFYMSPQPYWEPAEDCFIIHYTKTPVSAMGAEEGWDQPVGLPMEILPLTRPYGLYAGNTFTGQVLYKGKPLADCVVEVEYFNRDGKRTAPTGSHVTQVVKTDANGVFTWAMPWSGWWGFAALHSDPKVTLKHDGKDKEVEQGGVIWVYVH